MKCVLFTSTANELTALTAFNDNGLQEEQVSFLKRKYPDTMSKIAISISPLSADDADVMLDAFYHDYRHYGEFSEPFVVSAPGSTYTLSIDEGKERFEQRVGRPPTEREFDRLRNHFANGLHETGLWDTLDEAIDMAATE